MIAADKIAHEFAMVYITNRYGAEVKGTMSISSAGGEVGGWGTVETVRLPDPDAARTTRVRTGEKRLLGLVNKTERVEQGNQVDEIFHNMVIDYRRAFEHFMRLLDSSADSDS